MSVSLLAVSYNLPKFCPSATWSPTASNLAAKWGKHDHASNVFVNSNNTIYIAASSPDEVQVWIPDNSDPINTYSAGLENPGSVFASTNGDVYVGNGDSNKDVKKWNSTSQSVTTIMATSEQCLGLFIDINNTLYCSMSKAHRVIKRSLNNNNVSATVIAAGTGSAGSTANQLDSPRGIFVHTNFTLFVADSTNKRIQRFDFGNLTGTTVSLYGLTNPTGLDQPSGVVLDAEGYLFIADTGNNRIVGSGPKGFRTLVLPGQWSNNGKKWESTTVPTSLSFDSYGSIYVTSTKGDPVQKFQLASNSCGEYRSAVLRFTDH